MKNNMRTKHVAFLALLLGLLFIRGSSDAMNVCFISGSVPVAGGVTQQFAQGAWQGTFNQGAAQR